MMKKFEWSQICEDTIHVKDYEIEFNIFYNEVELVDDLYE